MKKFFAGVAAAVALTIAMTGCSKKPAPKPEADAQQYVKLIADGKIDDAAKMIAVPDTVKDKDAYLKAVKERLTAEKASFDQVGGLEKVEAKEADTKYSSVDVKTKEIKEIKKEEVTVGSVATVKLSVKVKNAPEAGTVPLTLINAQDKYMVVMPNDQVPAGN